MKHVMCKPWRPHRTPGGYAPGHISIVVRYKERYGRDLWVTWLRGCAQDYARAAAKTGVFQTPKQPL